VKPALRTAPFWAVAALWFTVHPTLVSRLLPARPIPTDSPGSPADRARRAILSTVNLGQVRDPSRWIGRTLSGSWSPARRSRSAWRISLDGGSTAAGPIGLGPEIRRVLECRRLGTHRPPSISSHAYYGCLGLGCWFVLAVVLERRPRLAIAGVAMLGLLRGVQAATPSVGLGKRGYMQRAVNLLSAIRHDLLRRHLVAATRGSPGHIPNNVGFTGLVPRRCMSGTTHPTIQAVLLELPPTPIRRCSRRGISSPAGHAPSLEEVKSVARMCRVA